MRFWGKSVNLSEILPNFSLHTRNWTCKLDTVYICIENLCKIAKGRSCELVCLGTVENSLFTRVCLAAKVK